jgi:hypothetical protein
MGSGADERDGPDMPAEYKNVKLVKGKKGWCIVNSLGGFVMMKMRLLAVVLFILGAAGVVLAAEVINVDIKGYNDNTPYVGNGAYDVCDNAVWTAYSGGWGVPVGSAHSESLVGASVPPLQQFYASVYAAQVWIGDNGQKHGYQYGSGLMDDGFTAASPNEPNISIWGQDAYQGVYDIYVYGRDAGSFKLTHFGVTTTQTVSGDANAGEFKLGQNYVVFTNVDVNSANPADLYLTYTNKLNALQFVSKKSPFVIEPNASGLIQLAAGNWDVAGDRNTRTTELARFGPDTFVDTNVAAGRQVGNLDIPEFMDYDITVKDTNQGQYNISLSISNDRIGPVRMYLDDRYLGDVNYLGAIVPGGMKTTTVTANLFQGNHTVRWVVYSGSTTGANLAYVNFERIGNTVISNCADVANYGFTLTSDFSRNCAVGLEDLALLVDNWLICNNPDTNGCF